MILDLLHELAIAIAKRRLLRDPSHENARHFYALINARSARQVARMEKQRLINV